MNRQTQDKLEDALRKTLQDGALSGGEERSLRQVIQPLANDREALAFVRNLAFRLARERIEQRPLDVLRWLERIDKIVDNTANPPAEFAGRPGSGVAFTPGDDGLDLIRRELHAARMRIDICVFTITDDRLTQAILAAHDRGVAVRLVTDNDKRFDDGSDIARLGRAGVPIRFDPDRDHMHHKFAVIDGRRLINGSYNWTRGATRNHENLTVVEDADLVRAFADEFDRLWGLFKPRRPGGHW